MHENISWNIDIYNSIYNKNVIVILQQNIIH